MTTQSNAFETILSPTLFGKRVSLMPDYSSILNEKSFGLWPKRVISVLRVFCYSRIKKLIGHKSEKFIKAIETKTITQRFVHNLGLHPVEVEY